MNEQYRIEDKSKATWNGVAGTLFKLFERQGDAFMFAGSFFRPGSKATDAECISHALWEREESEENCEDANY
jgi:hypothetical protein